jgi:glutaminyl-tRNA synthetase
VAKRENLIDVGLLEFCVREHLNKISLRRMVVFDPLKVVITNYPDGKTETLRGENNPEASEQTFRDLSFGKELYIEREDFMEVPEKKYFRLAPGQMVRLKNAYIIRCEQVVKDSAGKIIEVHCTHIPESRSGSDTSGIQVKGVIHWVSIQHCVSIETRLYDRLFKVENVADAEGDFKDHINTDSLQVITAYAEPAIAQAQATERFQFLRKGYFCLDPDSTAQKPVFNRTVTLRDMWAKENKKG